MVLLGIGIFGMYRSATALDTQCTAVHSTMSIPPPNPTTAADYFIMGDFDYSIGNCTKAVTDYTHAIELKPDFAEAYNNRAYTYMRMQSYTVASKDLAKALELRPNYINALMNQGDLYNYYGPVIDRQKAVENYNKVIALGGKHSTSACGHRAVAESNGIFPLVLLRFLTTFDC